MYFQGDHVGMDRHDPLHRPLPPSPKTVADLMNSPAVTASPAEDLAAAAGRMEAEGVGSVLVTDCGRLVGILTERDLVRASGSGAGPSAATVGEWMTPDPDRIEPDVEVVDAWRSLAAHGYRDCDDHGKKHRQLLFVFLCYHGSPLTLNA